MPVCFVVFLSLLAVDGWYANRKIKEHTIVITEQDIVRYCLDSRREKRSAKDIDYYCRDLGGDEFIAKGFKPNYDKFPSDKMFLAPEEPNSK